jgi:hypothetical protein
LVSAARVGFCKTSRRYRPRVAVLFVADPDWKTRVLPIFELFTDLCDQFSGKCDICGGCLLVGIFFFF